VHEFQSVENCDGRAAFAVVVHRCGNPLGDLQNLIHLKWHP
jgi:hypothetical protein